MPTDRFSGLILGTNLAGTDNADGTITIDASGGGGGALTLISDTELGSTAANIDITSIPGTYKHLWLFLKARTERAALNDSIALRFNNDSGANYDFSLIQASGATAVGISSAGQNQGSIAGCPAASAASTKAASASVIISDYVDTTYHKTFVAQNAAFFSTTTTDFRSNLYSGLWRDTSAITRITIISPTASDLSVGFRATLYGAG